MCWTYLHQRRLCCTGRVWTTGVCAGLGRHYTSVSWSAPVHVYATEAYVASEWTCLHHRGLSCTWNCLDSRSLCCSWTCLHNRVLSSTCPCLHYRGLCCTLMDVSTPQGPQLHLELPGQQEPVMILDVLHQAEKPLLSTLSNGRRCTWT